MRDTIVIDPLPIIVIGLLALPFVAALDHQNGRRR
jgi:hypothetical protein